MSNTGNTQQIIDYGAAANDGTGDPLRTAFIKTDENFDNIWLAGPVGSNITIVNNTIQNDSTNGNIIIKPNGIGIVQSNAHVVPNTTDTRNLGAANLRWRTLYVGIGGIDSTGDITTGSLSVSGDVSIQGNLVVEGDTVEVGNITTDSLTIQLANTAANAAQANGAGVTVGANDDIATLLYDAGNNQWTTNIGIAVGGNVTANYFIGDGSLLTNINPGNIDFSNLSSNITTTGVITANAFIGDGSQITGIDANNINGLATVAYSGSYNDLVDTPDFGNLTSNITTTGDVAANAFIGDGSQITGIDANNINGLANVAYTGDYDDLINTPDFGNLSTDITTTGNITGNYISGDGSQLTNIDANNIDGLANVAYSGSYNDLSDAPDFGNLSTDITTTGTVTANGGNINTNAVMGSGGWINANNANITGNLIMNSSWINSLADPVQNQDAATKNYVDLVAQGLHVHDSCRLATTQDLATYTGATVTYDNGISGVGATLTFSGNTLTTLDGVSINALDRLLIKNEANAVFNGIYVYSNSTVLTRSLDMDTSAEAAGGDFVFVTSGNTYADTGWVQTTDTPVIGTNNIVWSQFSGAGTYTANTAAGLQLTGTVFSAKVDDITTAFDINGNISVKAGAQLTTPNIDSATGTSLSVTGNLTGAYVIGNGSVLSSITGGNVTGQVANATYALTANVADSANSVAGANVTGTVANAAYALTANAATFAGTVTTNAQPNITSVGTLTSVSSTGNVAAGNLITSGLISAAGNITGNYLLGNGSALSGVANLSFTTVSANGTSLVADSTADTLTLTPGNNFIITGNAATDTATLAVSDSPTFTGNVTGGNLITVGAVSATGNITGNYILGNGSQLTGISASAALSGNLSGNLLGNGFGANNFSFLSTTGNVTAGNITTSGTLATTGAISAGAFVITNIATPAALTTNTNNWAPAGMATAMVLRISSTSAINLTGIAAPSPTVNQLWYVYNVGTQQIAFINDSLLSTAGNRFLFGNNRTLQENEGIILWYDVASGGWRSPGVQV